MEEGRLRVFENRNLRRICGAKSLKMGNGEGFTVRNSGEGLDSNIFLYVLMYYMMEAFYFLEFRKEKF